MQPETMVGTVAGGTMERREHPRTSVRGSVEVVVDRWAKLELHDVSLGGLRTTLPFRPSVGDRFAVVLKLPVHKLSFQAEVRNILSREQSGNYVIGLSWVELERTPATHEALRLLIEAHSIERESLIG
jgi:hypothetical protein